MPNLFQRDINCNELRRRVGDISQLAGVRELTYCRGREAGVRAAEVRTGSGLRYNVILDRGMDISQAEYKGIPLSWRSANGDVHPSYYDSNGAGWTHSFAGGLMTGCGITYLGAPCIDEGEQLGLHGRISNTPAEEINVNEIIQDTTGSFEISGSVREISFARHHLVLRRTIWSGLGESAIHISDNIRNEGAETAPFMMLYHINLGWPLLDAGAKLFLRTSETTPRDPTAEKGLDHCRTIEEPYDRYEEQVFYHEVIAGTDGNAHAMLVNRKLGLGLLVRYRKHELPNLIQWKMLLKGYYVLGIEPANCLVEGRRKERQRGTLKFLEPDEEARHELSIMMIEGNDLIDTLLKEHSLR
jgi:hypothetical protein